MGKTGESKSWCLYSLLQRTYIVYVICSLEIKLKRYIYIFRLLMKYRIFYVYYKIYKSV